MAAVVVPQSLASPLSVSPHWTVMVLAQPDHAIALPVEATDATRIATTTIN
jgi:hypothetical protein